MITATVEQLYQQHIKPLPLAERWQLLNLIKNDTWPATLRVEPGKRGLALLRRADSYQALAETVLENPFMVEPEFITALEQANIPRPYRHVLVERQDWLRQLAKVSRQMGLATPYKENPTLEEYRKNLVEYEAELHRFEKQYKMSSAEFYQKFEAGELGDAMDFFDWSGLVEFKHHVLGIIARMEAV